MQYSIPRVIKPIILYYNFNLPRPRIYYNRILSKKVNFIVLTDLLFVSIVGRVIRFNYSGQKEGWRSLMTVYWKILCYHTSKITRYQIIVSLISIYIFPVLPSECRCGLIWSFFIRQKKNNRLLLCAMHYLYMQLCLYVAWVSIEQFHAQYEEFKVSSIK